MKILVVHNFYIEPGGEDYVFHAEVNLLREKGHDVKTYEEHNDRITKIGKFRTALSFIWNNESYRKIGKILDDFQPDVVHFHNTFPLISPSAYYACHKRHIPVVQSLHNSRLICPAGRFYKSGKLCMACSNRKFPWPGVLSHCYHHSALQTFMVGLMSSVHRIAGTWSHKIDAYIVFSQFYKKCFQNWGINENRIFIKSHFLIKDPGMRSEQEIGNYALFVGRFSYDKGLRTLLEVWRNIKDFPLILIGDGEEMGVVKDFIQENHLDHIKVLGKVDRPQVIQYIKRSKFVIIPSEVAETFGLVALESLACGVPVFCSKIGALSEMIEDSVTGYFFEPGNSQSLEKIIRRYGFDSNTLMSLGRRCRRVFEVNYTLEKNYEILSNIYKRISYAK